jgi:dihydrolipoamide dehydrogenase
LSSRRADIVVIGAGPGGYVAALRAAGLGASVAVVEKDEVGGTCLNRGCIPTKAILASTGLLRGISRSREFGISVREVSFDTSVIAARSRGVVETMRKGVEGLLAKAGVEMHRGDGVIKGPGRVEVATAAGTVSLKAGALIIATGSEWIDLPGFETDGKRVITSDDAFSLDDIPARMAIVGGGAVGCEFAEIYSALGAETTIVEMMGQLLPGEDAELARRLEAALKRKGIKVAVSTRVTGLDRDGEALRVLTEGGKTIEVEKVMVAVGRKPSTAGLGLEAAGLGVGKKGIAADARMQTNVPGVYAIGDVTGKFLLAHVASAQGVVAAENACGHASRGDGRERSPGGRPRSICLQGPAGTRGQSPDPGRDLRPGEDDLRQGHGQGPGFPLACPSRLGTRNGSVGGHGQGRHRPGALEGHPSSSHHVGDRVGSRAGSCR